MKIFNKCIYVMIMLTLCNFKLYAKQPSLSHTFAKRYLSATIGKISSTSKLSYSTNPQASFEQTVVLDNSFSLGFGYSLEKVNNNLYLEYNVYNNKYWNFTRHPNQYLPNVENNTHMMIFHWVHELGVKKYYPIFSKRFFISPFGGFNMTVSRALKPGSDFSYDATDNHWFRYTSANIKPGMYAGASLNIHVGKRTMIFGQYKFQTQFSNNINLGEIRYIAGNGVISNEYKSRLLPYNHSFAIGISLSMENSAFYKK